MKIYVLAENTTASDALGAEHGLSLLIETNKHRILFDTGKSTLFAENAEKMGLDLGTVDIAVLSHGHYDHGGGLAHFLAINQNATVYMHKLAAGAHFAADGRYIGIDPTLASHPRVVLVEHALKIDDTLQLKDLNALQLPLGESAAGMLVEKDGERHPDAFLHEQYLSINENGRHVLVSGCSHKGIFNIVNATRPDVLVGGFHFMKIDTESTHGSATLADAAARLLSFPTAYYTCHCTGEAQFATLKHHMGDRLTYLSTGTVIEL